MNFPCSPCLKHVRRCSGGMNELKEQSRRLNYSRVKPAWCQAEQGALLSALNGLLQRWVLHRHVYIVFPVTAVCSINKPIID